MNHPQDNEQVYTCPGTGILGRWESLPPGKYAYKRPNWKTEIVAKVSDPNEGPQTVQFSPNTIPTPLKNIPANAVFRTLKDDPPFGTVKP